mgnify:CR=1 FL=1
MAELVPSPAAAPPMTLPPANPLERIRSLAAQPAVRRVLPWFLGLAAIGGAGLAYAALAPAPQRVLYAELGDAERAGVAASLDKTGIAYTINSDTGALSVGEDDLYKARMLVASDGALAVPDPASSLDSLPLGASRTLEGERLRGARQGELELTIKQIDGVESVRVHLAEGNKSVFVRDDSPPTASVMVRMATGRKLGEAQVSAIVNLVAGSVPGLSPDAVRVADQHGRLLSDPSAKGNDRIELQARLEDKLRTQLDQLLTPMLGLGNFTSEIQVELDMDEVTSARESYDKDGVVRTETSAQSQASASSPPQGAGIPGALSNTPPPATQATPGPPQGGPAQGLAGPPAQTTGESSAARTYELGRQVSVANSQPGKIKRVSVAVAISQAAMKKAKPGDIEQIKALVSAAMGADPARGDQVQVMVRPFEPLAEEAPAFWEAPWFAMVLRYAAALLAVLLVLLIGVRPLIRALRREPRDQADTAGEALPATPAPATDAALLGRQVGLAQRIVEEKPEDALLALRQMLGTQPGEAAR